MDAIRHTSLAQPQTRTPACRRVPCIDWVGDSEEAGQGQLGATRHREGARAVGWCGSGSLGASDHDPGWSWKEAVGECCPLARLQGAPKQHPGISAQLQGAWPQGDTQRTLGNGKGRGVSEMSAGPTGRQGFEPGVIKPIPVLPGIKPHRDGLDKGQEPWPCLKGLADDPLSLPGQTQSLRGSMSGLGCNTTSATYELSDLHE